MGVLVIYVKLIELITVHLFHVFLSPSQILDTTHISCNPEFRILRKDSLQHWICSVRDECVHNENLC